MHENIFIKQSFNPFRCMANWFCLCLAYVHIFPPQNLGYLSDWVRRLFCWWLCSQTGTSRQNNNNSLREMRLAFIRGIGWDKLHTVIFAAGERWMKGPCNPAVLAALSQAAAREASCSVTSSSLLGHSAHCRTLRTNLQITFHAEMGKKPQRVLLIFQF